MGSSREAHCHAAVGCVVKWGSGGSSRNRQTVSTEQLAEADGSVGGFSTLGLYHCVKRWPGKAKQKGANCDLEHR